MKNQSRHECEHTQDEGAYRLTIEQFLEGGLLLPLFQPVVDLRTHAIYGYEGTIRGPVGSGLRSPLDLLARAHDAGLRSQLETACSLSQIEQFQHLRLPGRLLLNFSCETALTLDTGNREAIREVIINSGMDPTRLVFELNDHLTEGDIPALNRALQRARANGVSIALDNCDASPRAMRAWEAMTPDIVKIDRYLIEGLHAERAQREAVRQLQSHAEQHGTLLIAEGIEHPADLDVLRTLGIQYGQGYLTGRPSRRPNVPIRADEASPAAMAQAPLKTPAR